MADKRQRHRRDDGGAEVAQEQPHHQHGQDGALVQQQHRAIELFLHRRDEVEGFGDLQVGPCRAQLLQALAHARAHLDLAGTAAARDLEAHHRLAIQKRGGGAFGHRVLDFCDLVEPDAAAVRKGDLHASEFVRRLEGRHGAQRLLAATDVGHATGAFDLHPRQLARDVGRRGAQRLQLERVELDLHLAVHTAHPVHRTHAAHRQQQLGHVVVHEPGQRLFVHLVRGHGVGQHRTPRELQLVDDGLLHVARQIAAHAGHRRAHVVQRFLRALLQPELGGDGDHAVLHLGEDVLEALHRGQAVLDHARHVVFELVGRGTRQAGHDGDVGHIQIGEVLHLHRAERVQARQRQHDEQHDGRNRVSYRPG